MKKFICVLAFLISGTASAGLITVDFPSNASTSTAAGGQYFFSPSHTVEETYTSTGIDAVSSLNLALYLDFNRLNRGAFVNFDVLINSIVVGGLTFNEGDSLGLYNFSYSFAEIIGLGTYTLTLAATNFVPSGDGSVGFSESESFAQLSGDVASVPEPASIALLGLGLIGFGLARKRKSV
ncbi:PEP-CTERM sorting domain-containing protein [Alkalimarinus alittae]|uniref:PEP-CTERM sorting domain-containing protein n=1 Tax=Alkalimarinus alittae TaxID=2961619 RepID=A0ABY6MXQ5_9ALTE|nr:PEP-CTERM sorting domain-containing protein [Alkalimarinus alittae]UZE94585.1 PEP-CTERM sorting domain-containing protein [Alkalimarinus alittae]